MNYSLWTDIPDELRPAIVTFREAVETLWAAGGGTGSVWEALEMHVPLVANPHAFDDYDRWWVRRTDLAPFNPHRPGTGSDNE